MQAALQNSSRHDQTPDFRCEAGTVIVRDTGRQKQGKDPAFAGQRLLLFKTTVPRDEEKDRPQTPCKGLPAEIAATGALFQPDG